MTLGKENDEEMSLHIKYSNITWPQFESCNEDPQTAFEKMCRLLFNRYFFDNKALLHSNPNNPGVEVEPIIETKSHKHISFQSKYFSSVDYAQIKKSAEKTVKYYSGQLDILYLYCNKDLTTTSKPYQDIKDVLNEGNIELKLINNQTIFDQVIIYPVVASLFFNHHGLTNDWFNEHLKISLDSLGPRFNNEFNVETKTEEYIDLFSQNFESIECINQKKSDAVKEIEGNRWQCKGYYDLIDKICKAIMSLDDVKPTNILQCLDWSNAIYETFSDEIAKLGKIIDTKEKELNEYSEDNKKRTELENVIRWMEHLIDFPSLLEFNEIEKNLLQRKILIVKGDAGVGKSQLFANAAEKIIRSDGHALLLLGQSYLSDDLIIQQILSQLGLHIDIDELLSILEGIGESQNQHVVIFIDAINESGNKDVWKTGLIQLINKIDKLNHVRLAISVRTGYEPLVFNETVQQKIRCKEFVKLIHAGFKEESVEATKTFLNHFNIPFSPTYFLQREMTNPLFLTLFCKTYNGEDFDIFTLFDRVIEKTDKEAQKAVGLDGSTTILKHLIYMISELKLNQGKKSITKKDILELGFWNTYGLTNSKTPFIASLEKSGLLISSVSDETEYCFLGYNLLEDFICAKLIIEKYADKVNVKTYLQQELLKIENGKITNYSNQDIFIVVCSLYAEKFNEECIDIINSLSNEFDKNTIKENYINSYLWRKSSTVDSDAFLRFLNKNNVTPDKVWRVFIENSTKPNHPLNAELLHEVLMKKPINIRDYIWTTYINRLADEEERLFQLVDLFDKGNCLNGLTATNIKLLLILFSWLLTSSNRILRDKASKAMIELLKTNFSLCKTLLETFETINDPYVIQRLYGIVFGACMKRTQKYEVEYRELSEYVYNTIFNKDTVYPDILLRDYARLILERWLYEFDDDNKTIDIVKIKPPYRSEEIPDVKREEYYQENTPYSGFNSIAMSMLPNGVEGLGWYGDFGRYVFQSAVEDFDDIDMENIYHYAMQFIRDGLGYNDKLLGEYDSSRKYYYSDRHQTCKIERIGKKYQWIAMYNILARISDTNLIKGWDDESHSYQGAWEPYVRDFDPTLNCNFLMPSNLPIFDLLENKTDEFAPSNNESEIREWAKTTCALFDCHSKLMLKDTSGQSWVLLKQYKDIKNKQYMLDNHSIGFANGSQEIWAMSHGYIVKKSEFDILKNDLEKKNFMGRWFPEAYDVYQIFNREYAWSPSYKHFFGEYWIDYEVETDEKIIKKYPDEIIDLVKLYNGKNDEENNEVAQDEQEWDLVETIKETLGQVMPTSSHLMWEENYDASQEKTTAFDIPCKDILDYLQLEQNEYDGYFYGKDGTLVSFDGNLANIVDGLLIRKDYLDKYLSENGFRLFWACLGEKQFFLGDRDQIWGEWSGFIYLEGDNVIGTMENKKINPVMVNNLPFINDNNILGKWSFLNIIQSEEDFDENKPTAEFNGKGFKEIYFLPDGEKYWIFEGWTKGQLFIHYGGDEPVVSNSYEIKRTDNGLFMLLKVNADSEPYIQVLRKTSDKRFALSEIGVRDNIDLPFVMDERVVGLWESVDFVENICDFNPTEVNEDTLWLKSVRFKPDGTAVREYTDETWEDSWTKGKLIDKTKVTAASYEIRDMGSKDYLFLEWKMGNYVYGGAQPDYYVFVRVD